MQFYKKRDFGTFISDSLGFFKLYGKNYFKNYFLLNGLVLILLVLILIFGYREFFMPLFGSNMGGESYYFEDYFNDNLGIVIGLGSIIFIISLVLFIINYLFPVFYIKRLANGQTKIKTDDILNDFKDNSKKIAKLVIGLVFIIMPLATILIGFSYLLIFILIGFFILLFVFPVIINIINFLMYDYFNSKRRFFESLSYSIRAQFSYSNNREGSPFWKYWGATLVLFIIMYVISTIFTMIPMIFFMMRLYSTSPDSNFEQNPLSGGFGVFIFVIYGISSLISFCLSNILYVNSGLMYYDSRRDFHQKVEIEEIESIGVNE